MPDPNPYQSPAIPPESLSTGEDKLSARDLFFAALGQAVIGGLGLLTSLYNIAFWGLVIVDRNPIYQSRMNGDTLAIQVIITSIIMALQSLLIIAGSVSMFQRKRRWLALTGAWAGILPMCGCYLISLVAGIWILVVLRRPEVSTLFAAKLPSGNQP